MENNWYHPQENTPPHDAQTGQYTPNYYAANAYGTASAAPPSGGKSRARRAFTAFLIVLGVVALIACSCFLLGKVGTELENRGFSFSWFRRGGESALPIPTPATGIPEAPGQDGGVWDFFGGEKGEGADEDGSYDNFEDFFDDYYTAYEEAEACTIPAVSGKTDFTVTLRPHGGEKLSLQEIYTRCSPSIVAISAYESAESDAAYSWGTGIILSRDGYIVTNAHIVAGSCRAVITLQDDREFEAKLVGTDNRSDIAVLKIDAADLTPAEFGVSDGLAVGDEVAAIGNPLGSSFRCTLTNGIISGIDRDIAYNGATLTLIQTNAALNEGNSGGALVNMYGQVIGITNMKMSSSYVGSVTIEGVGFAIPAATVKSMADSLLKNGAVTGRPALGITVGAIPEEAAARYALPEGLYVSEVKAGSDCQAKGLKKGDVITHVNGSPALTTQDVTGVIADMGVGDTLTLTVFREGKTFDVAVALVDVNDVY